MKRRTQKIFITLLSLFIAGFAMVNAYTFEVLNWNPFGVLNLKTLIMKPDVNTTGIIIDGASYTIKIDPNHETEDGGIRVDRICDENGVNCKKVSELGIGGGGAIAIEGDAENFCFKKDDTTLVCDNEFLRSLIESRGLGGSINIDGQDRNYCYRLKETNTLYCDNTNLPTGNGSAPGNGTITIIQGSNSRNFNLNDSGDQKITLSNGGGTTSGAIAYGSGEYICVKNGNNLDCSKAKLGELKSNSRCTFDGTSINCIEDKPNGNGGSYTLPSASTTILGGVKLGSDTVQTTTSQSPSTNAGRTYPVQFDKSGRLVVNVPRTSSTNGGSGISMGGYYVDNPNYYCISTDSNSIRCNVPMPTGTAGSSDSLWKTGENDSISPLSTSYNVNLGEEGSTDGMKLNVVGDSKFVGPALFYVTKNDSAASLKIDGDGLKIREAIDFYMGGNTFSAGGTRTANYGLSVGGPVAIGYANKNNYIYIYAQGNKTDEDRHYEIMGSNELAVGTISGGFLYFNKWTNEDNKKYSLGVNTTSPKATLDINGSLRISSTCSVACSSTNNNYGTIIYYNDHFYGCRTDNKRHGLDITGTINNISTSCVPASYLTSTATQVQPQIAN